MQQQEGCLARVLGAAVCSLISPGVLGAVARLSQGPGVAACSQGPGVAGFAPRVLGVAARSPGVLGWPKPASQGPGVAVCFPPRVLGAALLSGSPGVLGAAVCPLPGSWVAACSPGVLGAALCSLDLPGSWGADALPRGQPFCSLGVLGGVAVCSLVSSGVPGVLG